MPEPPQNQEQAPNQAPAPAPVKGEQEFFVRLQDQVEFRRKLLESSKYTLGTLKGLYELQQVRDKKREAFTTLRKEMKEIKLLVSKLDEYLPQYTRMDVKKLFPRLDLDKKDIKKAVHVEPAPKPLPPPVVAKQSEDGLSVLTRALASLEEKMASLPPAQKAAPEPPKKDGIDDLGKALFDLKSKLGSM